MSDTASCHKGLAIRMLSYAQYASQVVVVPEHSDPGVLPLSAQSWAVLLPGIFVESIRSGNYCDTAETSAYKPRLRIGLGEVIKNVNVVFSSTQCFAMSTSTFTLANDLTHLSMKTTPSTASGIHDPDNWSRAPIALFKRDSYSRFVVFDGKKEVCARCILPSRIQLMRLRQALHRTTFYNSTREYGKRS